jgi:hypothetical protein
MVGDVVESGMRSYGRRKDKQALEMRILRAVSTTICPIHEDKETL